MSNANVVRIGQINGNGDVDALFLKQFAGEVLTAFEGTNVMMDKHTVKTISKGKSTQFPRFGRTSAQYHVPGNELLGQNAIRQGEVVISIDDLLVSHEFIANIDEAKAHYDARSIYSTEMGRALAKQMDQHLLQVGVLAARATNVVQGLPGGSVVTATPAGNTFKVNAGALAAALFAAAAELDAKDVPEDGRYCFLKPQQYYMLVQNKDAINKDWGGAGMYSDGKIWKVAGIEIVKTNNLPSAVVANGTVAAGTGNKYAGDFAQTAALVMQKTAIATVKLFDLGMESEYQVSRQGHLFVAKYAVGHGILRPEAAVEIKDTVTGA